MRTKIIKKFVELTLLFSLTEFWSFFRQIVDNTEDFDYRIELQFMMLREPLRSIFRNMVCHQGSRLCEKL